MYKDFFGFQELPFKLVPNPSFLFLSRSHEEALAHLTYAVTQGDGFAEITGEVGTGKTTLCRAFLETLDDRFEAAYIFNPALDAFQLLRAINDEFGIDSAAGSIKGLIDSLNSFLMNQKALGKRALLLIDEAQNLSKAVLEQLRLLSNLETTQDKLLQIILVGQPELGELLDSHDLRQLGQRITLNCHLMPLTLRETREYIRHRVAVAARKSGIPFSPWAARAIYAYSGGIPRLINIACDRALLTAFGRNQHTISWKTARAAIGELTRRRPSRYENRPKNRTPVLILLVLFAGLSFLLYTRGPSGIRSLLQKTAPPLQDDAPLHFSKQKVPPVPVSLQGSTETKDLLPPPPEAPPATAGRPPVPPATGYPPETPPAPAAPAPTRVNTVAAAKASPAALPQPDIEGYLQDRNPLTGRRNALQTIFDLWQEGLQIGDYPASLADNYDFFRLAALQNGFELLRVKGDLALLLSLDLPAILELRVSSDPPLRFAAVLAIDQSAVRLQARPGRTPITVAAETVGRIWTGTAYIPWKNFFNYTGVAPITASDDTIAALKKHLREIGFDQIPATPGYDPRTRTVVKKLQEKHGIEPDGLIGPMTKIILYNAHGTLQIPNLSNHKQGL